MGRWRNDDRTRRNRTRRYDQGGYDSPRRGEQGYGRRDYRDDEGYYGDYGDRYEEDRYYRDRDHEREYYWREREQKQETRRTGMMVIGGICIAVIALLESWPSPATIPLKPRNRLQFSLRSSRRLLSPHSPKLLRLRRFLIVALPSRM